MINDGMETKAVVSTMMTLSISLFRRRAATAPSGMPTRAARHAATTPSRAEVFMPSAMMSMTMRPRCFRDGPKSNFVTISFR